MGKVGRPQDFYIRKAWKKCQNEGMTQAEAARALGKSRNAASKAAKRYGFKFVTKDNQKTLAAKGAGSTRYYADVKTNRLALFPEGSEERMIYNKLKRCGYTSAAAYAMVVAAMKKGKK